MPRKLFYGWAIVAALFVINVGIHATANFVFGLYVIPMGQELGISRSTVGWVLTVRLLAGGVSSYFIGRLLDLRGPRLVIAVSGLVAGLAVMGLGFISTVWQFLLLFAIVGLTGISAPGNLHTSVPVAKWFVRQRGRAMAIATSGLAIGGTIMSVVTDWLITEFGWRTAWTVSGALVILVIVPLALLVLRRQPEDMGLLPDGDVAPPPGAGPRPAALRERIWTVREAMRTPVFYVLVAAFMLVGFATGGFLVHRVPHWVELGVDSQVVALALAADSLAFGAAILVAGVLLDRYPARYIAACAIVTQGLTIGGMLIWTSTSYLFLSSTVFGIGAGTSIVVQIFIWAAYYGRSFVGSIRGVVLPTTLVANGLGAPAVGYLYDTTGNYLTAWGLLLGLCLAAGTVVFLARPPATPAGTGRDQAQASPMAAE